jgi:peptidoglycan hydrolase-like protein with peptidoglycan-binding domain
MNARKRIALLAATAALGGGLAIAPAAQAAQTAPAAQAVSSAATPPSTISKGDTGHGVWCVQRAVNNYYKTYYNKTTNVIAEDAIFGTSTADWVAWYQGKHGLHADSIVGSATGHQVIIDDGYYGNYCKAYVPH